MITSLEITGFRSFKKLKVDRLARVNLFVGRNSAGKTSILEAVELLATGSVAGLLPSIKRRFERKEDSEDWDPAHLFHGRELRPESSFSIAGKGDSERWFRCIAMDPSDMAESDAPTSEGVPLALYVEGDASPRLHRLSLSGNLGWKGLVVSLAKKGERPPVNFLGTETVDGPQLQRFWDSVVLTPEEEGVIDSLKVVEPRLQRIAFLSEGRVFVKLEGIEERLPLGTAGDGLKRLLNLSLQLFSAKGGFLLVDEIDTGLHYTVMTDMWRLVIETARRLDVQVFATTHSQDCVHALAWIREAHPDLAADVMLHRVEKDQPETVAYSADELATAARHHVEVR